MDDTLGNGTNSSIPFMPSEDDLSPALLTATNSINLILGLPTNSYVVWLILSGAGGTIASEFFYLNLIASVVIFSLTAVFYFAWLFTGIIIFGMVRNFAYLILFFSVPSLQSCICVERYIAVVHPVVFLRYKALWYRVACCCAVWLTVFAFSSAFVWAQTVVSYILVGFCIVCISVVSFCCFSVLRALKQPGPGEGQRDRGEGNNMMRRAFKIILISLMEMLLTTMGYIISVLFILNYSRAVASYITCTISMISTLFQPLLYIHKAGKLPCCKGL